MSNFSLDENRWRELAARIATETDPKKLMQLIEQLCEALNVFRGESRLPTQDASSAD
jgi:hypothetical protein